MLLGDVQCLDRRNRLSVVSHQADIELLQLNCDSLRHSRWLKQLDRDPLLVLFNRNFPLPHIGIKDPCHFLIRWHQQFKLRQLSTADLVNQLGSRPHGTLVDGHGLAGLDSCQGSQSCSSLRLRRPVNADRWGNAKECQQHGLIRSRCHWWLQCEGCFLYGSRLLLGRILAVRVSLLFLTIGCFIAIRSHGISGRRNHRTHLSGRDQRMNVDLNTRLRNSDCPAIHRGLGRLEGDLVLSRSSAECLGIFDRQLVTLFPILFLFDQQEVSLAIAVNDPGRLFAQLGREDGCIA